MLADSEKTPVLIPLHDNGRIVGGLSASTSDQWLFIDMRVVPQAL